MSDANIVVAASAERPAVPATPSSAATTSRKRKTPADSSTSASASTTPSASRSKRKTRTLSKEELEALIASDNFWVIPQQRRAFCTCRAVRTQLRNFLDSKRMSQTRLQQLMHVNSNSWARFMNYSGELRGMDNGTFWSGQHFLDNLRHHEGRPMTQNRKALEAEMRASGEWKDTEDEDW